MPDDRRSARRAHLAAVRTTYESATGERKETEVSDVSRGGLFLKTEAPLAVGKRVSLEIQVLGETSSWPALGRVVWNRTAAENAARPAGMAIKFIDIDEPFAAAIDRLVQTREPTNRGIGTRRSSPGDRTLLGVGLAVSPEAPPAVIARETVFVAEQGPTPAHAELTAEPSIAIDLVARKSDPALSPDGLGVPAASDGLAAHTSTTVAADRSPAEPLPATQAGPADAFPSSAVWGALGARDAPRPAVPAVARDPQRATPAASYRPPEAPTDRTRDTERPAGRRKRGGRGVAILLIIAGAAAAAAYVFRSTIVDWWAQIGPALRRLIGQ